MSSALMRIILLAAMLSCYGCAARAQSITVTLKGKTENLSTLDTVGALPCSGIQEKLSTKDGAIAFVTRKQLMAIIESLPVTDAIAVKFQQLMRVIVSFPSDCKVALAGNVATCSSPNNSVTIGIAGNPGATVSDSQVTVTQP